MPEEVEMSDRQGYRIDMLKQMHELVEQARDAAHTTTEAPHTKTPGYKPVEIHGPPNPRAAVSDAFDKATANAHLSPTDNPEFYQRHRQMGTRRVVMTEGRAHDYGAAPKDASRAQQANQRAIEQQGTDTSDIPTWLQYGLPGRWMRKAAALTEEMRRRLERKLKDKRRKRKGSDAEDERDLAERDERKREPEHPEEFYPEDVQSGDGVTVRVEHWEPDRQPTRTLVNPLKEEQPTRTLVNPLKKE